MAGTDRLDILLALARVGGDRPLDVVLRHVSDAVRSALGFRTLVINVYRPAFHDFQAVLVTADDPRAHAALDDTTNAYEAIVEQLLLPRFERVPGVYLVPAESEEQWTGIDQVYTPVLATDPAPDAWRPEDALLVALRGADGTLVGVLSVDEPASGRRPADTDLEWLVAVAAHAALAIERAQREAERRRHDAAMVSMLELSAGLPADATVSQIAAAACRTLSRDLGFDQVAVLLEADGELEAVGCRGLAEPPTVAVATVAGLGPESVDGGWLVPRAVLETSLEPATRLGSGPHGWHDAVLVVPLWEAGQDLTGVMLLAEPRDCRLPEGERRRELRLLADQVAAGIGPARRRERLSYLATHDPLTALRNRRGLSETIERLARRSGGVAVLVCDLDHFKAVNDRHGHDVGDRVLRSFADLLLEHARATDAVVRLGGEEFCLLLAGTDAAGAAAAARRLCEAAPTWLSPIVEAQTVSIGISIAGDTADARTLLAAADEALYAAKAAGRDRFCFAS